MKKIFWFYLLFSQLSIISIYPQEKQLFGLGPFDWGISKEEVKSLMKDKFDLLPGYQKADAIGFESGKYFGENIHVWAFFFNEDKLNEVDLVIKNDSGSVGSIFYGVVHNISDEHGDPDLFKPDDWTAEWYYYEIPGKKLNATIKISPYSGEGATTIKITFLKI